MADDQQDNPILKLLERHSDRIGSLTSDVRDMSIDILVLRAVVFGLIDHAKETGIDLRPACMAIRDSLPEEHRATFVEHLKTMYGVILPL